jgi:tellurite resistance protein TerA
MEIKQKGAAANVPRFKQMLVTLKWSVGADFDMAALYEAKDGRKGLVYYGEKGDMNAFPFMQLSGDEGVGDKAGANEEQMRICALDEMKTIHLICWDYTKVQTGEKARFAGSDVQIVCMDDTGTTHNVKLDCGDMGNVCVVATIDNASPLGARLVNTSKAGTLKGLSSTDQLFAVANS